MSRDLEADRNTPRYTGPNIGNYTKGLEASELRIGNIVSVPECSVWITTGELIVAVSQFKAEAKPIPLTEEWLQKAGFLVKEDEHGFKDAFLGENPITTDWMLKLVNTHQGWFYRNAHFKIDYLHQLQNLYFALTGEELVFSF